MSAILTLPARDRTLSRARILAWLRPSLLDFMLVALLVWLVALTATGGSAGLLQDAGTGYHVRVGDLILRRHAVPRTDGFSFTHEGQPWYAWEWLSGVLFSVLYAMAGLKGIILFTAALIVAAFGILVRHMIWKGANALTALFLTHVAIAVGSLHFLARPHLFTLFFMAVAMYAIERDRAEPSWHFYLLIPLTTLWANLHGGFAALPTALLCFAGGDLIAYLRGRGDLARVNRYALVAVACLLASGLNPYGFTEHAHLLGYVNAEWARKLVLEWQAPTFEGVQGLYVELMVLGSAMVLLRCLLRGEFHHVLLLAFWLHAGLHSVRHLPVLSVVVLPLAAVELQQGWDWFASRARRGSAVRVLAGIGDDHRAGLARLSVWPAVAVAAIALSSALPFPADFPPSRYPVAMVTKYSAMLEKSRVFSTDAVGDYLIYRLAAHGTVFVDGRSDMYGPQLTSEYLTALNGGRDWERVLAGYRVNAALIPSNCGLASLLRGREGWEKLEDGPDFTLFQRSAIVDRWR